MRGIVVASLVLVASAACLGQETPASSRDRRLVMIDEQLKARGIANARVLDAMGKVPREQFVPPEQVPRAYADMPLPIGQGQTISQPFIVAYMTEVLGVEPAHRVLEIGTGSGYQAAILGELAREVYTIEIVPELARRAAETLKSMGYGGVQVREGTASPGGRSGRPSTGSS